MKKLTLVALFSVFTLTACGGAEAIWTHPTKDHQGFTEDRGFCSSRIDENIPNYNETFSRCMESQGWIKEAL